MSTPITRLTPEQADRIRLHRGRVYGQTFWWVSIDGRWYLREDYPTKEAARRAALARLTALDTSPTPSP